jgi:anti-anti-sigma regulatory factor
MMAAELSIVTSRRGNDSAKVTVLGHRLDGTDAACLRAHLTGLLDAGVLDVLLDLSAVRQPDQSLADTLAWASSRFRARGGLLTTTGASAGTPTGTPQQPPMISMPHPRRSEESVDAIPVRHGGWPKHARRPETADQP